MRQSKKRIIIVGATSAIAEHCARIWVHEPEIELILVARNLEKLACVTADLQVRNPHSIIQKLSIDFSDQLKMQNLVDDIFAQGAVDIVLIAHGFLPDQNLCQQNLALCREALEVNGISPVLFAEAFLSHMQKINHGVLAIIGSVAGDRGRKTNYVYGAAKSLIATYIQGLQHRFANTNIKIILIKPGPTATPMTASLPIPKKHLAPVEAVAEVIVKGIAQGKPEIYVPKKWQVIMFIVKHIPRIIFNKLNL